MVNSRKTENRSQNRGQTQVWPVWPVPPPLNSSKPTFLHSKFDGQDIVKSFKGSGMVKGDRLLTVTLGISGEIEIWKMGKIRTIVEKCNR